MGRGSIQIGRGRKKGEEELYIGWAGAYYAQRSLIQPISRHPLFHVTITGTIRNTAGRIIEEEFKQITRLDLRKIVILGFLVVLHCT